LLLPDEALLGCEFDAPWLAEVPDVAPELAFAPPVAWILPESPSDETVRESMRPLASMPSFFWKVIKASRVLEPHSPSARPCR